MVVCANPGGQEGVFTFGWPDEKELISPPFQQGVEIYDYLEPVALGGVAVAEGLETDLG